MLCVLLIVLYLQHFSDGYQAKTYLERKYPASVIEDAFLETPQLLRKYNYPAETHYVTTADDYVVSMHRITNPGGRPVLLMHGLTDSSVAWILMGPWSGLGYFLHDNGYDVWLANARGNRYSRNHTKLNPDVDISDFWNFSLHEIGIYDLPAMIDYILYMTGYNKLGYIGHSQGTTVFWVMASMLPAYNQKITMMHALAPVAYIKHVMSPLKDIVFTVVNFLKDDVKEVPHTNLPLSICFLSTITDDLCMEFFWKLIGRNPEQFNHTMRPVFVGHLFAGFNLKQLVHYMQIFQTDRFALFDYGPEENQRLYGSKRSPEYPLERITAPIGLHYTQNDYLVNPKDLKHLTKRLSSVVFDKLYPYKEWNHITLYLGIDARELVHKQIIQEMRKWEGG